LEKEKNWYSIIQYIPNNLRGEIINVGVMLHNPQEGKLKYNILDVNNGKMKSLLINDVLQDTYRIQKECIEFYLEKLPNQITLFDPNNYTNQFLEDLKEFIPNEFKLSEPTFSKTLDSDRLLSNLMEMYIGKEYLSAIEHTNQVSTKKYIKDIFEQRKLIGTKVKWNAKITPIKNIKSMQYTIDFVYKNGIINFLQTVPTNTEQLTTWFAKLNTVLESYDKESNFYVLFNKSDLQNNNDKTLKDMLSYLKTKDQRIFNLNVESKTFNNLCNKIESEGKNLEEFEKELTAV
jgi:hypothetical protein